MFKYLILFSAFVLTVFAEQRIEILESVEAKAGKLSLKDIAIIEGFSLTSQQELESLEIEAQIKQGELRKYSDSALTDLLRRKLNQIKAIEAQEGKEFNLVLKMPKLLEVFVSSPIWTKAQIEKNILQENKKFCAECEFKIQNIILPEVSIKKISRWQLEPVTKMLNGSFQVPLKVFSVDKKEAYTYYVSGRMSALRKLPISRRNLNASDRITAEDVIWEKREWNFSRRDIPSQEELLGARLKRTSLSGSVLWLSNLERPLAVQSGDLVDVVIKKETWEIRMKAVAQGQGVVGDHVSVKSRETQKILTAKIIANGEVELR